LSEREYIDLVLADFEKKLKEGLLPLELVSPTRSSLKAHSFNVITQRFDIRDELLLRSFFGQRESASAYANAIDKISAEKFRTLHNFLTDRTKSTEFININLLAWLINFQPRPYRSDLKIEGKRVLPDLANEISNAGRIEENKFLKQEEPIEIKTLIHENGGKKSIQEEHQDRQSLSKRKINWWLIGVAALLLIGIAIKKFLPDGNNCMFWNGEHYVATQCNLPRLDTPLVRLDLAKLRSFRRIRHVDTLSYNSVGKLWYVRVGRIIEVYSSSGKHPLYPNKKLAPLNYYAVNVCKKQTD
jgi:hypothetical protein